MSDLFRQSLKDSSSKTPPLPIFKEDEAIPDDHNNPPSDSSSSSAASADTLRPTSQDDDNHHQAASPTHWTNFFAQELSLPHPTPTTHATYHVYLTPPTNPTKHPLILLHHGAGSSALTFALLVQHLRTALPDAGILALEARGHGGTVVLDTATGEWSQDYSLDTLTSDALTMLNLTSAHLSWPSLPRLLLIGHSLGGAVVTKLALEKEIQPHLIGTVVLDVVEGSAVEALGFMNAYLASRPQTFSSEQEAITWHIRSRTLRNASSARISVPPLLTSTNNNPQPSQTQNQLTWHTPLPLTVTFWPTWFTGMSARFLRSRGAKLLVLAGTDRLDKELMVGQMQGKFQLEVVPGAGHFVHEDAVERVGEVVVGFWRRNSGEGLVCMFYFSF